MKLTLQNIKQLKQKTDNTLTKKVCNYIISHWQYYDDKKSIFTDVLDYGCQSGYVSELIYYSNTTAFYKKYKEEINEKVPKTRTSIRDIPLTDSMYDDMKKHYEWCKVIDNDFDNNLDKYYVAVNMYREPVGNATVGKWLSAFEKKNGFKHISCHGLRHTYCSLLLSQNVPIQTVSKYMGHSDSTITLKVYSHFIPDTQEKVVNALNNLF